MSALTCDFCGRVSLHMDGWRQLFSRSMSSHDDEVSYMICEKCHKKIVEENVGAIVDPEVQLDAVRESYEDSDPAKDYIGMTLRDFLCSGMYLQTQNNSAIANDGVAKVTLRGEKMWGLLDRVINIVLPRVRDFRGISADAFDGRGNYSLGLKEQIIFPEIEYDKIEKLRGMNIAITTTAKTDEEARELLKLLGAPFMS